MASEDATPVLDPPVAEAEAEAEPEAAAADDGAAEAEQPAAAEAAMEAPEPAAEVDDGVTGNEQPEQEPEPEPEQEPEPEPEQQEEEEEGEDAAEGQTEEQGEEEIEGAASSRPTSVAANRHLGTMMEEPSATPTASVPIASGRLERPISAREFKKQMKKTQAQFRRDKKKPQAALEFDWVIGYSCQSNGAVQYLGTDEREDVFYPSGHTGVLYSRIDDEQTLLQGHRNPVTCCCSSADKKWLATADMGEDAALIIWDTTTSAPVQNYFADQIGDGLVAVDFSQDAMYLATLTASSPQRLSIWDWTSTETNQPVFEVTLDTQEQHFWLRFNPENPRELVSNGSSEVLFYQWSFGGSLTISRPRWGSISRGQLGSLTCSVFVTGSVAVTSAKDGMAIVWDKAAGDSLPKAAVKKAKLCDSPVTFLTLTPDGQYIASGSEDGVVRFFDHSVRLIGWNDVLELGPIASISFSAASQDRYADTFASMRSVHPTFSGSAMQVPDYVVGTSTAVVAHVVAAEEPECRIIVRGDPSPVHALAVHPTKPRIVIAGYSGRIRLWDYERNETVAESQLPAQMHPQCIAFDATGDHLAVGFTNGRLQILDLLSLSLLTPTCDFRLSDACITHVKYSADGKLLAYADENRYVALFEAQPDNFEEPWSYIGRNRAHGKRIVDLLFGVEIDSPQPRLLSLGADRMLAEYDLANASILAGLQLKGRRTRVEQSGVPTAMAWYPEYNSEHFVVTANDHFKCKLFNSKTKMCRKTLLAPTYGSPLQQLVLIEPNVEQGDTRIMAWSNDEKIGLTLLPMDGNPYRSMAVIAHPTEVTELAASRDGKWLFTAGGRDGTVHCWKINAKLLQTSHRLGGEGLKPFLELVEGGEDGEVFAELKDYFYFAQLRHQGVASMETRQVSDTVPLSEVPAIMRGIGFFPSEQEIEDMTNEVKFSKYAETNEYVTEVDLDQLTKLYVNHRPAFGVSPDQLEAAFEALGQGSATIPAADLLELLQGAGEHMSQEELIQSLGTLLGEGGLNTLPEELSSSSFAEQVLGF